MLINFENFFSTPTEKSGARLATLTKSVPCCLKELVAETSLVSTKQLARLIAEIAFTRENNKRKAKVLMKKLKFLKNVTI